MTADKHPEDEIAVDLKNRGFAALLAWLVPGLGHMYQGRMSKGIAIFVSISFLFVVGLQMGGGKVVYCSFTGEDLRWQFLGQAFIGSAAVPAVVQNRVRRSQEKNNNPRTPLFGGRFAPPAGHPERAEWLRDYHAYYDIGTLYTLIAGVLNMFAIFDAYGGPAYWYEGYRKEKSGDKEGQDA